MTATLKRENNKILNFDYVQITPTRHTIICLKDNDKSILVTGFGTVEDKQNLFKNFNNMKNTIEKMYGVDTFTCMESIKIIHNIEIPVYSIQIIDKNMGSFFDVVYHPNEELEIKSISFVLDLNGRRSISIETMAHEFTHELLFVLLLEQYGKGFLKWHYRLTSSLKELLYLYYDYNQTRCLDNYLKKLLFYGEGVSQITAKFVSDSWKLPKEEYKLYIDSYNHLEELRTKLNGDFKAILSYVIRQLRPPEL